MCEDQCVRRASVSVVHPPFIRVRQRLVRFGGVDEALRVVEFTCGGIALAACTALESAEIIWKGDAGLPAKCSFYMTIAGVARQTQVLVESLSELWRRRRGARERDAGHYQ